ncbi:hypothetical protein [Microbacterium arborescens]|nr:hypothetical protein [Microbacterium arborescens]
MRALRNAVIAVAVAALAAAAAAAVVYVWAAAQIGMTLLYVLGGGA